MSSKTLEGIAEAERVLFKTASRAEIMQRLAVSSDVFQKAHRKFPVQWPDYYFRLSEEEAVARMGRPTEEEWEQSKGDIIDPISDQSLRPVPFLVRKHRDRVIILTTKKCHFYCRFCFRREEPVSRDSEPSQEDWDRIYAYLSDHPEIEEPILSGGDPLTLDDQKLFAIRDAFRQIRSIKKWRIHSRAPVVWPQRMTPQLISGLVSNLPLCLVAHYNHAAEVTTEARRIAQLMHSNGITYKNQAVLLAGVNDSLEAQLNLWRGLYELGIEPHYLHHPDRVPGNAQFRVSIEKGLELYRQLKQNAAFPLPAYVLDLPDGRGKIPVQDLELRQEGEYHFRHPNGQMSVYCDIP